MRCAVIVCQHGYGLPAPEIEEANDVIVQFEAIKEAPESVRFRYYNRYQLLMSEMYLRQEMSDRAIELARRAADWPDSNSVPKNIARSHWLEEGHLQD
jgi:hypothetical protein